MNLWTYIKFYWFFIRWVKGGGGQIDPPQKKLPSTLKLPSDFFLWCHTQKLNKKSLTMNALNWDYFSRWFAPLISSKKRRKTVAKSLIYHLILCIISSFHFKDRMSQVAFLWHVFFIFISQLGFTCSKFTIETWEQGVKYAIYWWVSFVCFSRRRIVFWENGWIF